MGYITSGQATARFLGEISWSYLERLRIERPDCFGNPAFFPAKVSEEAGEFAKEANKRLGFHRDPVDLEKEAEELADLLICAYAYAVYHGIDLIGAIESKNEVLQERAWKNS